MTNEAHKGRFRHWVAKSPSVIAPLLMISAAIAHSIEPKKFGMDWPSVALLIFGVVLVFIPMRDIAAMVKSLELGKVKILMKDKEALTETTAKAEVEVAQKKDLAESVEGEAEGQAKDVGEGKDEVENKDKSEDEDNNGGGGGDEGEVDRKADDDGDKPRPTGGKNPKRPSPKSKLLRPRSTWTEEELGLKPRYEPFWRIAGEVAQIAEVNPKAGLVRLAISIESTVVTLATELQLAPRQRTMSFRHAMILLEQTKIIPRHLSEGLVQFMELRNKIVHLHLRERIEDEVVTSATRNGMTLLHMLLEIASSRNVDPVDGETIPLV
jgi:uncharacterized protein YutE (UPF0331/DUF86 family)